VSGAAWFRRGDNRELCSGDGRLWVRITRTCPSYRVRFFGGPMSMMTKVGTLREAIALGVDWYYERTR
jgi:hypothetical protein